jgi:hypothetical protein
MESLAAFFEHWEHWRTWSPYTSIRWPHLHVGRCSSVHMGHRILRQREMRKGSFCRRKSGSDRGMHISACAMPELRREGRQDWTSTGDVSKRVDQCCSCALARIRVVARLGEMFVTTWVSVSVGSVDRNAWWKVLLPNPRNRVNNRVEDDLQCWKISRREVGSMCVSVSPRSLMPSVPYRMERAIGVVNAVEAVALGSRRPSPPFEVDCRARALECGGRVGWDVSFSRHVSVHALTRLVKGPNLSGLTVANWLRYYGLRPYLRVNRYGYGSGIRIRIRNFTHLRVLQNVLGIR